ncbi:MAG: NYN domain-containing protein [Halobacteriales archaeon]|nr:NYN domain-containing protein [Halobacteriales archaeon]
MDYFKVGEFLRGSGSFRAAFYYIADVTAQDGMQNRFLDFLAHSGYIVRKKPVKVIEDKATGQKVFKANVDTEMVLDMVNTADNYDVAFLLSGDSDFERCVDLLRSRGKRVYVMTSESTISRELSHVADKPIFFIEDYQDLLARVSTAAQDPTASAQHRPT